MYFVLSGQALIWKHALMVKKKKEYLYFYILYFYFYIFYRVTVCLRDFTSGQTQASSTVAPPSKPQRLSKGNQSISSQTVSTDQSIIVEVKVATKTD